MAKTFSNTGVTTGQPVLAAQVSQSFDAFTGAEDYDITISGSLELTGSLNISGSGHLSGSLNVLEGITGSILGTASTASFVTGSDVYGPYNANSVISSSHAVTSALALDAETSSTASFVTGSDVYGPEGANSVITSSHASTASYFDIRFTSNGQGTLTASINGVDEYNVDLGVMTDDDVEFAEVTGSIALFSRITASGGGIHTTTLTTTGNTNLGNSTTDELNMFAVAELTGSLTVTASITDHALVAYGEITASNGTQQAVLRGNDLIFDRAGVSYVHNKNTGGTLQLGIGSGAGANAFFTISGSGDNYGNTARVGNGTLFASYNETPSDNREPIIVTEIGNRTKVFTQRITIKNTTYSTISSNHEILTLYPSDIFGTNQKFVCRCEYTLFGVEGTDFSQCGEFHGTSAFRSGGSGDPLIQELGTSSDTKRGNLTGTNTATMTTAGPADNYITLRISQGTTNSITYHGVIEITWYQEDAA